MLTKTETIALIEELTSASQVYYIDGEESPLTDEEFDAKLELLETLVDEYEELFVEGSSGFDLLENAVALGASVNSASTTTHAVPMLSLKKAKNKEELYAWVERLYKNGASDFTLQVKLDGFPVAARYVDGHLTSLTTRGNGVEGESATYLIDSEEVTIVGLPKYSEGTFEVRGELFLSDKQFADLDNIRHRVTGSDRFKNSRNGLVGTMKKAAGGLGYSTEVSFGAYSWYKNDDLQNLSTLSSDFITTNALTKQQAPSVNLTGFATKEELFDAIEAFGRVRDSFTIPTDGVVIKPVDEATLHNKMGNTSHHPSSQIAYKYPGPTATTEIIGIDVTVGKTGRLTPVARIRPVDLHGVLISNISLHNFNWIISRDLRIGSTVVVKRANDVIPQVAAVVSSPADSDPIEVPSQCPVCESELVSDGVEWPPRTLSCKNNDCVSRMVFALRSAVGRDYLNIDGMSESLLDTLTSSGRVSTIADLFTLTESELADATMGYSQQGNPRRLGESRARNIVEHIEKAKKLPLYKIMASLGVDSLGRSMSKALIKHFGSLSAIQEASIDEISSLEGFGLIRATDIVNGLHRVRPVIDKLRENGVQLSAPVEQAANTENAGGVAGLSFSISGAVPAPFANRSALVDWIESQGGSFHSGPKKNTSFFIGNKDDSSSKVKKATSLGVEFISAEEFTARFV